MNKSLVNLTLPVYNEEKILEQTIKKVLPLADEIIISDNASTDNTERIGRELAKKHHKITYLRTEEKGVGAALKNAWNKSKCDILTYMDVDLSSDINKFNDLINLKEEDLAIGIRMDKESRGKRKPLSNMYNKLTQLVFKTNIKDFQCGFKAVKKHTFQKLNIKSNGWFFDTELIIKAKRKGIKIKEVPLDYVQGQESKVRIISTTFELLRGILKLVFSK